MANKVRVLLSALLLVFSLPVGSFAQRGHGGHHRASSGVHSSSHSRHGRIKRSAEAKKDFMRQSGYPHVRKGYVVDHIVPLACGGADAPSNM